MTIDIDQLQELADRVVALVGDRAEANVRVTRTRHGLTRFANSFIHQHVGEDTVTVAVATWLMVGLFVGLVGFFRFKRWL
jgi:3-phenylpropionate/cinnamic acid dioxygenase small subunit